MIPDMDSTKPAQVNPEKFVTSINENQVTYSFGSPAIWNVVSNYCIRKGIILESVEKVLMAGAPVQYDLLKRVQAILPPSAKIFTPYGATESLPIVSIESREVLSETWELSKQGKGTCVGRSLPGIEIKIIQISDQPVSELSDTKVLENDMIGEIIVRGDVVTKAYQNNDYETKLAKIKDGDTFWHRMGDVGYLDSKQRLWFCGRRAHRVVTDAGTLYSIPCEAIINEHPEVYRSALVGIIKNEGDVSKVPVMIVEPVNNTKLSHKHLLREVQTIASKSGLTVTIDHFLIHQDFPVDIRHNAKIFREKLALWAQKKIFPKQ